MALCLVTFGAFLAVPQVAAAKVPRLYFPVVGHVHYQNDFGAPRGQGVHQGNDIMADRKAPVVAVEAGKVRIYTASARAGCMLYLFGKSGTTYLYIHLNNDKGKKNDNKGGCKLGVAYAPGLKDGQRVRAGQLVAYVGDSGDANGLEPHLHFELHRKGSGAVSPFRHLRKAERLLYAVPQQDAGRLAASAAALTLTGTVVSYERGGVAPPAGGAPPPGDAPPAEDEAGNGESGAAPPPPPPPERALAGGGLLTIKVRRVALAGDGSWRVTRKVVLAAPAGAVFETAAGKRVRPAKLAKGAKVTVTTEQIAIGLSTQRARPGVLRVARLVAR